jgi:hypothetical protein
MQVPILQQPSVYLNWTECLRSNNSWGRSESFGQAGTGAAIESKSVSVMVVGSFSLSLIHRPEHERVWNLRIIMKQKEAGACDPLNTEKLIRPKPSICRSRVSNSSLVPDAPITPSVGVDEATPANPRLVIQYLKTEKQ